MHRFHASCDLPIGTRVALPEATVRHMQVLRLQPGDEVDLFNGRGGVHQVRIEHMARQGIEVQVLAHRHEEREAALRVHLVVGMPANERMDWLVEKATELGIDRLTPLMTTRSVLRLEGERAQRRMAHWQGIAAHACAQCGRNRLPTIDAPMTLNDWLQNGRANAPEQPWLGLLSLSSAARAIDQKPWGAAPSLCWVMGPEGGLTVDEESLILAQGATPVGLGTRVLRVETAALAALVTSLGGA